MRNFILIVILVCICFFNSSAAEKKVLKGWDINYWGTYISFTNSIQDFKEFNSSLIDNNYHTFSNKIPLLSFGINYGKLLPYIDQSENLNFWEYSNNWFNKNTFMQANIQFSPSSLLPRLMESDLKQLNFNFKLNYEIPVTDYFRFRGILPGISYNYNKLSLSKIDEISGAVKSDDYNSSSIAFGIGAGFDFMITDKFYNDKKEILRKLVIGIDLEYYYPFIKTGWYGNHNSYSISSPISPQGLKLNLNFGVETEKKVAFDFIKEQMLDH